MTSDASSSTQLDAPGPPRPAEKRGLLASVRVPHPVVSTWELANLEISVLIGSFPVAGAKETFVKGEIVAVVGGVAANVSRALGRLGVSARAQLVLDGGIPGRRRTQRTGGGLSRHAEQMADPAGGVPPDAAQPQAEKDSPAVSARDSSR